MDEYGLIVNISDIKVLEDNNICFTYWDLIDDPNITTVELNFETEQERDKSYNLINQVNK